MSSSKRILICSFIAAAVLIAATASHAQSPFDGTWKTDLSKTKFAPKPYVFYISQGWYHCVSCDPAFDIPADGQDHAVSGQPYDTLSVTIVDPHTISVVAKKGSTVTSEQTRTVSADGKTLTVKSTGHPQSGGAATNFVTTGKRSGIAPSGVHATSGEWIIQQQTGSSNALLTTYKTSGDQITMTSPTGETYTAKFDGNDYPYRGAYAYDAVSLKKINDHSFEELDKRAGAVIDDSTLTVSPNGKTMTVVDTSKPSGRVDTFVATKQ
ncbi:MAG TPA: hypothetical protein VMT38_03655 [Terracidiphilus sp.]|nr:hypothetical protein [Terracidiphilus sp.]